MVSTSVCPLLSAGSDIDMICLKEKCAWYIRNYKMCSVYVLAHNAALDIKEKQVHMQAQTQQSS